MPSAAELTDGAADRPMDFSTYLTTNGGDRIIADAERIAARRPVLTVGVGILSGLIAARIVKSSAAKRCASHQ